MQARSLTPLLYVSDPEASLAFYQEALGFAVTDRAGEGEGWLWARLQNGEAALMLNSFPDGLAPATRLPDDFGCVLYMDVDDVHALYRSLRDRGHAVAPPEPQVYGVDQLWLRDPDGYQLCFTGPRAAA